MITDAGDGQLTVAGNPPNLNVLWGVQLEGWTMSIFTDDNSGSVWSPG